MIDFIIYAVVGILAGILSGLFGIGGGIIIVPGLIFLKGFSQIKAQGTSLVAMLPPVGILAFMQYYKKGNVDIVAGIIICIAMVIAAKFGGQLANQLPVSTMKKAFGIFIILVGIKTFFGK
ncbi:MULTISPECIES: sulfite exporter TauE/SafE family protein [Clostridium]|uniref:sulfite exporter TauE/SafE family protein n=1 Tax=Clostridium TaxID=1485 RepID=UPI00082419EC|nr:MULTISPECIES: sulfite exporter TauE/SafE family protein [Clostridium]PJI08112.1 sulfite exporter TauE/SafE family protein [Clostridium sp. CT7]